MSKPPKKHIPLPTRHADEIIKNFRFEADAIAKNLDDHLRQFVGLKVKTMDGPTVYIETIVGSKSKPTRYVINDIFEIVILDFHRQVLKDNSITDDMIHLFDQMEGEVIMQTATERAGLIDPFKQQPKMLSTESAIQSIRRGLN